MSRINFYDETYKAIVDSNHTIDDIDFFSMVNDDGESPYNIWKFTLVMDNRQEVQFSFDDFKRNSNFYYDNGYGTVVINLSLKIIFKDGTFMERREYDGSELWEFVQIPKKDKSKVYTGQTINFMNS